MQGSLNMNEQNNSYCQAVAAFFSSFGFLWLCLQCKTMQDTWNHVVRRVLHHHVSMETEPTDGVELMSLSVLLEVESICM